MMPGWAVENNTTPLPAGKLGRRGLHAVLLHRTFCRGDSRSPVHAFVGIDERPAHRAEKIRGGEQSDVHIPIVARGLEHERDDHWRDCAAGI